MASDRPLDDAFFGHENPTLYGTARGSDAGTESGSGDGNQGFGPTGENPYTLSEELNTHPDSGAAAVSWIGLTPKAGR